MASTNKTTHYELPQWIGTDKPTFLGDMNQAYEDIDTAIYNAATAASNAASAAGSAQSAAATAQSAAESAASTASAANTLATTANTNAVSALNAIGSTPLDTTAQTLTAAVNEVNDKDAEDIAFDDTGLSITADNVQDAIEALAAGGMTTETIRYDATTGYIQLKDSQGWFNWAKATRAIFDAIADSSVLQTMGYSTNAAPTVTPGTNSVTLNGTANVTLGWVYIPPKTEQYTVYIEGTVNVASPSGQTEREAVVFNTYDTLSGGSGSGATQLDTVTTTSSINKTFIIPANKYFAITIDGQYNGNVVMNLTTFYGK